MNTDDNWKSLCDEYVPLIGRTYHDSTGNEYRFIGLLHGEDDYYYVMRRDRSTSLLSCVRGISEYGFTLDSMESE